MESNLWKSILKSLMLLSLTLVILLVSVWVCIIICDSYRGNVSNYNLHLQVLKRDAFPQNILVQTLTFDWLSFYNFVEVNEIWYLGRVSISLLTFKSKRLIKLFSRKMLIFERQVTCIYLMNVYKIIL